ncbi:MAG TPA: HlyD family type I secretion periplasmic adaptor subunit [Steroidobacteraceae bacterium]|jgi:hemolysin D|nr:HlyD family type I secretion periplasmic adaptor subunit [Steroidobacteraceae bacterium]
MQHPRLNAIAALLQRYGAVWRQSWRVRHELDAKAKLPVEIAFLPAHLEIVETPVHPAPRWTARICALLALGALVLTIFGRLDIVAVAPGKLVPNARVKVVQPAVTGVVRSILVRDGMRVQAGQLLMELDPTQAAADTDKATATRLDAQLTMARSQALLQAQSKNAKPVVAVVPNAPDARQNQTQAFADGIYGEYRAKMTSLQAELEKREAELATTDADIAQLNATAPLAQQQADDYKALSTDNYVARHDYLDKQESALTQKGELAARISHSHELQAAIAEQKGDIQTTAATFRRNALEDLGKAQEILSQASNDQTKAEVRQAFMRLVAPVSGTVQQLSVHTVGGVVTTAQPLLEIVPDDALEVEARLENKDIGFVEVGQSAIVKVDAFPYTRFGYLQGTVVDISNDAVSDKHNGLYFVVRVKIPGKQFRVEHKWVNMTPGMEVKAEIRTGTRSVAEYFLSPLMTTAGEALRER